MANISVAFVPQASILERWLAKVGNADYRSQFLTQFTDA